MTHCTVCGAAAREGAKFCTSCGARLVDTVTAPLARDDTATLPVPDAGAEPGATDTAADAREEPPAHEVAWASTVTGAATGEVESVPAEPVAPAESTPPADTPEYATSWPAAGDEDDEPSPDAAPAATATQPEEAWSSWRETAGNGEEPSHAAPTEPATAAPDRTDGMDESHHGASAWESWAPEASGEATVPEARSNVGASVRRMLDELAERIDRLIDPVPIAARGVDADELAGQLERWSSASTDADGLLEVVRAVRTSPRDVDALTRLADRAPDLELLVRHYQAVTGDAGDWARRLREQQAPRSEGE